MSSATVTVARCAINYRVVERESFRVVGRRRVTPIGGGTWEIVKSDGSAAALERLSGHRCDLGLCFGFTSDGSNDYLCGVEWEKGKPPDGFDSYLFPSATWLVVHVQGAISARILETTWREINHEILSQSRYERLGLPTMEKYLEWSETADACSVEVWIPVVMK